MRSQSIRTAFLMTFREQLRNRVALVLLLAVPTLFYAVVALVSPESTIAFKLAMFSESVFLKSDQRKVSFVFMGMAAVAVLSAFVGLNLVQRNRQSHRRLVLCGMRSYEVLLSKLSVLGVIIVLMAAYSSLLLSIFFRPPRLDQVFLGFALGGIVYGAYGLLVGAICRRELEGVFLIVLMANIDPGWLQNPVYYADAANPAIVRALPAYHPAQLALGSAFAGNFFWEAVVGSIAYAAVFLSLALVIHLRHMRTFVR